MGSNTTELDQSVDFEAGALGYSTYEAPWLVYF